MTPIASTVARKLGPLLLAALLSCALAADAAAKGLGINAARVVELPGSPYRYTTLNPGLEARMPTVVLRIERDGGRIDRWWRLRGRYYLPATAYDLRGGGISRDGGTLVLQRFTRAYPPRRSRFAVLDTAVHLRHPLRPGEERPVHAVRRIEVPGFYSLHALSPDGETAYLTHHLPRRRWIAGFELSALDLAGGRLLPGAVEPSEPMEGVPITQIVSPDRRWAYTLYDGNAYGTDGVPFLLALDTVAGKVAKVELPQLREPQTLFLTKLRLTDDGGRLVVFRGSAVQGRPPTPPLLAIDTRTLRVTDVGAVMAALGRRLMATFAAVLPAGPEPFLAFARTPRRPGNMLSRYEVVGRSSAGRPIEMWQYGDPAWSGELLVFGCIHGDECGAGGIKPTALSGGCPDPSADIHLVPDLNPDGAAAGSRLNGRGVDLNRNFPSEWRPFGQRGDPEYAGPKPSSEPETRLAERIVRELRPEATVWFHQFRGQRPFVRAWGQSEAAGRRFAHLARMPFRAMRWPAGTAPNWQNHRFPGTSSFVVELPRGRLEPEMRDRLAKAIVRLGRWVRED
jgi:protein MpaA